MTRWISTPSYTKEILEKYGLRAKKGFGQNFLVDPVIVERCAQQSHCEGAVIEIGPGIGSLTEQLARFSKHVTAYEIDEDLLPVLKDTLSAYDNVEILLEDFLETDLDQKVRALKEEYGTVSVCANLPYYVTTPILFKLFEGPASVEYITVMVQKEVGERFSAAPGTPEYSALSVESQYLYDVKKLFTVPRTAFSPAPKVDSAIIQFHRKPDVTVDAQFFELVRASFQQRRKTLYNNLKEYTGSAEAAAALIGKAGLEPGVRAQELDVPAFERLSEATKEE